MWEAIRELLQSQELWSIVINLLIGAIIGAFLGVRYSLSANRPKLIIFGGGAGGNQTSQSWQITMLNRPSFFGQVVDGETARDVIAFIRLDDPKSEGYMVFWGHERRERTTIEPGQRQLLEVFHWQSGTEGYFIVDRNGEPVAKFHSRELKFVLTLRDLLERKTEFRFIVEFDDTHLTKPPRLRIIPPITIRERIDTAKGGIRDFLSAFRAR
jgi:hypothetical protein